MALDNIFSCLVCCEIGACTFYSTMDIVEANGAKACITPLVLDVLIGKDST